MTVGSEFEGVKPTPGSRPEARSKGVKNRSKGVRPPIPPANRTLHGDCDRSLGPGGFCSLGSTTSTRGPRISLPIASSSSSSTPAYDSSVLSLYFRIHLNALLFWEGRGIIGGFSCKHFSAT